MDFKLILAFNFPHPHKRFISILYSFAQKMFLFDILELFRHMTIIKLDFSRNWKLYLMKMLLIKSEETK